ncbi:MAG: FtsH protease activity modulator HflK [Phycisphaerae bacterium]|nr:FtsH protease activity modulator HflK [Phycisphaerae bacterium]
MNGTGTFDQIEFPIGDYWRRYHRHIGIGAVVILAIVVISSVFYMVDADSEGVLLRFGKYVKTTDPGLHVKLFWPIETVYVVPVRRIQSLEFGFATAAAGRVTQYARRTEAHADVARMLTGDLNLAHVEWIVQYRISDARHYLFKIGGHPDSALAIADIIQSVSEAVMRKFVGDASVDEVLTIGRDDIASDAEVEIQKMLDTFEAGIEIVTVKMQSTSPPEAVKKAFDDVNRAKQKMDQAINKAWGVRNSRVPAADGERKRAISEARGYSERVVQSATGQVNAFLVQLAEYEKAPEVTRTRLYLEAMEKILSQVDSKIVIDESVRGLLPLLDLGSTGPLPATQKGGAR